MFRLALLLALLALGCTSTASSPQLSKAASTQPVPSVAYEIEPVGGLGLFREERIAATKVMASWAQTRRLPFIPPERVERAWDMAREGRSPITGAACGMPLTTHQARTRWLRELGGGARLSSDVHCEDDGGCTLFAHGQDLENKQLWEAEVLFPREGSAVDALALVAPGLHLPTSSSDDVLGGIGAGKGSSEPVTVQLEDRLQQWIWSVDARDRFPLPKAIRDLPLPTLTLDDVKRCMAGGTGGLAALFELDGQGRVGRCEPPVVARRSDVACLCKRLGELGPGLPPALRGHRWEFATAIDWRDLVTPDGRFVVSASAYTLLVREQAKGQQWPVFRAKVADPSIGGWRPPDDRAFATCFLDAIHDEKSIESRWAVWFDAVGHATKAVEQKGHPPLSPQHAACVGAVLMGSTAPCPARDGLWAEVRIYVHGSQLVAAAPSAVPLPPRTK